MRKLLNYNFSILLFFFFWVISLINCSGYGESINSNKLTIYILIIFAIIIYIFKFKKIFKVNKINFILGALFVTTFMLSSVIHGYGISAIDYCILYLCIFIFSKLYINNFNIKIISLLSGILGLLLLYIFTNTELISGWNPNSISMLSFFSFMLFLSCYGPKAKRSDLICFILISLSYIYLFNMTDTRSCIVLSIIMIIIELLLYNINILFNTNKKLLLWLLTPLFIVGIALVIRNIGLYDVLNDYSLQYFGKSLFNGRDLIWQNGIEILKNNFFIGRGFLQVGYWHNSAIAALTGFGIIGYSLWIWSIYILLKKTIYWMDDFYISHLVYSFLFLFVQQSTENIIFQTGNIILLPYIILGLIIGRIYYLKGMTQK